MKLSKRTGYPRTISVSASEYGALLDGKYESVVVVNRKTCCVIKEVSDIQGMLKTARSYPFVNKNGYKYGCKFIVMRFQ